MVMSISNLPYSTIENTYITVSQSILVAVAIVSVTVWLISKNCNWLICSLSALLIVFMPFTVNKLKKIQKQALCVYYSPKQMMSQFVSGGHSYWINGVGGGGLREKDFAKGGNVFWSSVYAENLHLDDSISGGKILLGNGFFVMDGVSGLIIYDSTVRFDVRSPMTLDFLIVSGEPKIKASQMPDNLTFRNVIIDASVRPWVEKGWMRRYADCNVHNVRRQGAFICEW